MKFHYNQILLVALVVLFVLVLFKGYIYTFVYSDFSVRTYVTCDPVEKTCFMYEDEIYAYAYMPANEYATCSIDDSCNDLCSESDICEMEYCSEDLVKEGESCITGEPLEDEMPLEVTGQTESE
jgi:hypothetical protein